MNKVWNNEFSPHYWDNKFDRHDVWDMQQVLCSQVQSMNFKVNTFKAGGSTYTS